MRKDTRPSPAFLYCKQWKNGEEVGTRLSAAEGWVGGLGNGVKVKGVAGLTDYYIDLQNSLEASESRGSFHQTCKF